ncbi:MAG: hypothetical protein ACLUDU_18770 [Butyricimonas faecihominis]
MSNNGFVQEKEYENLNAPILTRRRALLFILNSLICSMPWGIRVQHNLGTNTTYPMNTIALGENETVTMLKFNLYRQCSLNDLNNQSDEFMAKRYELMVGSWYCITRYNAGIGLPSGWGEQ